MDTLSKWMAQPSAIWVLAIVLFSIACLSALLFEIELLKLGRRLKRASALIDGELKSGSLPEELEGFVAKVLAAFRGDRMLSREWAAYARGIKCVRGELFASASTEQYFSPARVLQRHVILHYRAIPGVLVGLGLVFTFLGIAVVIHQASNLKASDELPKVLAPAALKFWTSLIGVTLSLVCAFHYRVRTRDGGEEMIVFARRLTAVAPAVGVVQLFQEMSALRSEIGTPAEDAIKEVVDNATAVFEMAIEKVHGAVHESAVLLAKQMGDLSLVFDKIAKDVSDSCNVLGDATVGFSSGLREASGDLRTGMENAASSFKSILGTSGEKLKTELSDAAAAFETSLGEASTKMKDEMEKSGTVVSGSLGVLTGKMREDFDQMGKDANRAKRDFKAVALDAEKAGKSLERISEAINGLTDLATHLETLKNIPDSLLAVHETLRKTASSLSSVWDGYVKKLEKLDSQLAGSLSELPKSFQLYADSLESYTTHLDRHLDTSLNGVMVWVQRIEEIQRNGKST